MDVKATFRKLITNQFIPDFDYMDTEFTFKTVYYVSKYSYCICPCAFEHEYLDYIDDNGIANDEVVEKLTQSIVNNQCPHVSQSSEDHIEVTGVYGIHIALAVGTDKAVSNSYFIMPKRYTKLYKLDPFVIAVMVNRRTAPPMAVMMSVLMNVTRVKEDKVQLLYRSRECENVFVQEDVNILSLCIRRKNIQVLNHLIKFKCCENDLNSSLKLAFNCQLFDIIKYNLRRLKFDPKENEVEESLILSIVYDQPYLLDFILQNMRGSAYLSSSRQMMLNNFCVVLQRDECKSVLAMYGIHSRDPAPAIQQLETLWKLLDEHYNELNDEIINALDKIPGLPKELSKQRQNKWSYLQKDILGFPERRNFQVLKTALDLKANPNLRHYCDTPLVYLLRCISRRQADPALETRRKVELFLYENLDVKAHTNAFIISLRADAYINNMDNTGTSRFIFDSKKHGVFGHDSNRDFVFNCYTPLLIACGFPIPADVDYVLNEDDAYKNVPLVVKDYVLEALKTPRCLAELSRDILRTHYKGRQIHTFVQQPFIPKQIRGIILLRPLLKCLSGSQC